MSITATDTIAAIATAPGQGGVGIVRVSGPKAEAIAVAILGRRPRARTAEYHAFIDDEGEIVASSSENLRSHHLLFALTALQASKIGKLLSRDYPEFTSINSGSDRYILARKNNLNLIMLLDSKMKLDVILPSLKQAMSQ